MARVEPELPADASRVVAVLKRILKEAVVGVYLYGSCTTSTLRHQSDLDLLVLVNEPVSGALRLELVADLLKISGWNAIDAHSRPLDVTVVLASEVIPWRYPPTCELLFGEWLRDDLTSQRIAPPAPNPDLAIQLTTVLQHSRALLGPPAPSVFTRVPAGDLRSAIFACLPSLLGDLRGDERNVLLTLARMWVTLATNEILPKDQAALWVMKRTPEPLDQVVGLARAAYLGELVDNWLNKGSEVDALVRHVVGEIEALS